MPLTSIKTSDAAVKTAAGRVYWIIASAAATGGAFQLNDSTDDGGTDLVSVVQAANTTTFYGPLIGEDGNPGIEFKTGIYADIPGTNVTLTIGYN